MPNALVLAETGGPENFRLEPQEPPPVGPGQLLVRNEAIGLNFIDIYQRKGLYPVTTPAILGSEGAGIIEAVGDGVEGFSKGDRVAYLTGSGAYAELIAVPAAMAATIPDSLPSDVAASVFLKGLTAEMLLKRVFPIEAGQSCLVYAAVGGVGTLLCQWAHHLGATVIAVVGSEEKAERARNLGADCVINRKTAENIATAARAAIGGGGVNVVYDSVGAATFEASLDALAPLGMM
ncbi:MAG: quinone oxidoreductase, partial [Pseudomonadota bacterium]